MNQETTVIPAEEDAETSQIPKIAYDFKSIGQLEDIPKDTMIGKILSQFFKDIIKDSTMVVMALSKNVKLQNSG